MGLRGAAAGKAEEASRRREPAGLGARQVAVLALSSVMGGGRTLEEAFEHAVAALGAPLEARDRAFARLLALMVLRRRGELDRVLSSFLEKPLPRDCGRLKAILLAGAAQLLFMSTPPHAAISLAVEQARCDRGARRFDRLVNAVLRRVAREGSGLAAALDSARLNVPDWLYARWQRTYGDELAHRIAEASLREAPLDLTVKQDAEAWAARLGGVVLPTGSVRVRASGRIEDLAGYAEGAWWVQDAAAALPARLLGTVAGLEVADLCAAPGGKTAQLAAAGSRVTAVDLSPERLARLQANLARLALAAEVVTADILQWSPGRLFDAVLLDAPCTATGTIRRHPDILYLKRESDLPAQAETQAKLLLRAAALVKPQGLLIYCTCSLEPEEGAQQIARFLGAESRFRRVPVDHAEIGGEPDCDWVTPEGDLRTLPCHMPSADPSLSGLDGFYAARLRRLA